MKKISTLLAILAFCLKGNAQVVITSATNPSCGNCNGKLVFHITGGVAPYTITILGGSCTVAPTYTTVNVVDTINNFCACSNQYTISVTDLSSSFIGAVTVSMVNQVPAITAPTTTNITCFGGNNGSICITPTGGVPPYTYSWNPTGGINSCANNLTAGNYTATLTDSLGCSVTQSFTITQPPLISISFSTVAQPSCMACPNGSICATATNGITPYTYSWSPGGTTTNCLYNAIAGNYTCCATDTNGCTSCNSIKLSATPYQKMIADSVTEFDIIINEPVFRLVNPQQTLNSCISPYQLNTCFAKTDSLYKGKVYKKITRYGSYQGIIREDTTLKRIYFISFCDTTETLLYDFSLQQGNTINYNFPNQPSGFGYFQSGIYTVDSIKLKRDYKNFYHKHSYLSNHTSSSYGAVLEMVEGVGNVSHPLFLYSTLNPGPLQRCGLQFSQFLNLILSCKSNNGAKVYYDSCAYASASMNCGFYAADSCNYRFGCGGIEGYANKGNINVYPSPTNSVINVVADLASPNLRFSTPLEMTICDVLSNVLINTKEKNIDVSALPAGVYFIKTTQGTAKFIKQ